MNFFGWKLLMDPAVTAAALAGSVGSGLTGAFTTVRSQLADLCGSSSFPSLPLSCLCVGL